MKKIFILLTGCFLTAISVRGQEIIPFPDLSEHYNFRNTGGEGAAETKYEHLDIDYRKALESLEEEIALYERRLLETEGKEKKSLQKELEEMKRKRSALLEEAQLHSDLLNFY